MLCKAKTLTGYKLDCLDGEIGRTKEFYFDDRYWAIRYLVADTGNWLTGRAVLISPYALSTVSTDGKAIAVTITKKQIEDSPSWNTDKPVSLQFEETYYSYYGWPMYWGGSYMWGNYPFIVRDHDQYAEANPGVSHWNPHLRSTNNVSGYRLQAADGEIGHVADFIIDDQTWAIRYLVIDTRNWWPGKMVLISPRWIESVSWDESKVYVNLTCDAIKDAPEFNDDSLLDREYEEKLHTYYRRKGYWIDEPIPTPVVKPPNVSLF